MLTAADNRADPPTAGPTSYASYPMWQGLPQDPSVRIPASSGPYDKACQGSRHLSDLRPCPTGHATHSTVLMVTALGVRGRTSNQPGWLE